MTQSHYYVNNPLFDEDFYKNLFCFRNFWPMRTCVKFSQRNIKLLAYCLTPLTAN